MADTCAKLAFASWRANVRNTIEAQELWVVARLPWNFDVIEYLVDRKFPSYRTILLTDALSAGRSSKPGTIQAVEESVTAYRGQLIEMTPAELEALVAAEKEEESREASEREEKARFFSKPEVAADFDHWSKAAYWTIDEAVALSLGKQPETVNWKSIEPYLALSPFAAEFGKRRMLATRARDINQLAESNLPSSFLAWAMRNRMDVPVELVKAVEAHEHQVADGKTASDEAQATISALQAQIDDLQHDLAGQQQSKPAEQEEKPLLTRERETVLKLIIGMAIGGYGYDPAAARSRSAREIADDVAKCGLSIDDDTVRKWLHEARQFLPSSEIEKRDD